MTSKLSKVLAVAATPLLLAACGGGSGGPGGPGGGTGGSGDNSFVGFPIPPSSKLALKGIGQEASVDAKAGTISEFASDNISADVSTDKDGKITALALKTTSGTKTWNTENSELVTREGVIAAIGDDAHSVIVADPEDNEFKYQTFGAWETAGDTEGTGRVGVFSVGSETAAADIPTSGTAKFKGASGGIYGNEEGDSFIVTSDASLDVNFAAKSVGFKTENTRELENGTALSGLDLDGQMSYAGGAMSGSVENVAKTMSGKAQGQFYGAGAAEVGGTFALKGGSPGATEAFVGGFGAVKQ